MTNDPGFLMMLFLAMVAWFCIIGAMMQAFENRHEKFNVFVIGCIFALVTIMWLT